MDERWGCGPQGKKMCGRSPQVRKNFLVKWSNARARTLQGGVRIEIETHNEIRPVDDDGGLLLLLPSQQNRKVRAEVGGRLRSVGLYKGISAQIPTEF